MKNIFLSALFILSIFLISQFVFEPTHLYYEIWWLDIPMHIFGGLAFALLFISVLNLKNKKVKFLEIVLFVMIVGILWEIYEYAIHIYLGKDWNGVLDTIKDLFDDLLGATLVYLFNKESKKLKATS